MVKTGQIQLVRYAPPPSELPIYQRVDPREVSFFGRTNYEAALEEKKFIFGIKRRDRRRHLYMVGKSGVGKTKLLELLIRQDIAYGHGLCLIDPHGDLVSDILDFVPQERINDVVLIDPSDTAYPVSFNPLHKVHPDLEHVFRFTCLALLDYPHATMRGMISMLTDRNYRQKVVEFIEDDMVKRFW